MAGPVSLPYPYVATDDFNLVLIHATGVADLDNDPVTFANTPAVLTGFNDYRDYDKLIDRVNIFSPNLITAQGVDFRVYGGPNSAVFGGASNSYVLPFKFFVGPFYGLGLGGTTYRAAEYVPPFPILVRNNEALFIRAYADTPGGGGTTAWPLTITTTFRYVNRDGVAPDRMYQG